ncbi:transposable element Tcb2 transposase [Trichonephila clavipes]|nr:transposable element Tcb2 transposase [Trichonephila clavipes]
MSMMSQRSHLTDSEAWRVVGLRLGQGLKRATTPNEDRYLVLTAPRHRNMNATLLQQHLRSATGTTLSTQTVRNRLHGVGIFDVKDAPHSCRPVGENVDEITEKVEVDRRLSSRSTASS